jgi:hypothetical protein
VSFAETQTVHMLTAVPHTQYNAHYASKRGHSSCAYVNAQTYRAAQHNRSATIHSRTISPDSARYSTVQVHAALCCCCMSHCCFCSEHVSTACCTYCTSLLQLTHCVMCSLYCKLYLHRQHTVLYGCCVARAGQQEECFQSHT